VDSERPPINATGRISEAQWIVLRTVRVGNKTLHDVDALVIDNIEAPLLLGRSALDRFGRISIDNKNGVIVLE
jgi:aspartyl protease family protein